jgi:hypothetical protein
MWRTSLALQKGAWQNLFTPCGYWEATKSGRGREKRTTSPLSFESYTANTGEPIVDVKEGGK